MAVLELALAVLAALLCWQWLTHRKRSSMPPGEYGWPILGRIPPSDRPLSSLIPALRKKHGDVFMWKIGARNILILCDYQTIKRAYNKTEFLDRPDFLSMEISKAGQNYGLFNSSGAMWHTSRRFSVHHLRDMGLGRTVMETAIAEEAEHLVKDMMKYTDRATEVPMSLNVAIVNLTWKLVADQRFELSDPRNHAFQQQMCDIFKRNQGNVMLFDFFPYLVPFTPSFVFKWLGINHYIDDCKAMMDLIRAVVKEHRATLDPDHPRDFIDAFLLEMGNEKNKGNEAFTEKNLVIIVADVFLASSETIASTIRWTLLYMAKYPGVQDRIQAELDGVVPRGRLPGLQDKDSVHYTVAALHEVERMVSFTPFSSVHYTNADTEIDGFHIPKSTIVTAFMLGCHRNPAYWEKPDQFYPEHFLDLDGKFKLKTEGFAPFSVGRRICPGANLSRLVIFLFCSALLHTFTFSAPEGVTLSTDRYQYERLFNACPPVELVIRKRA